MIRTLHVDGLDLDGAAADLIAGLRTALVERTPAGGVGPIAQLVAEETRRYNGVSLIDPNTNAAQVFVTMPTAALIVSAGLFGVLTVAQGDRGPAEPPASSGIRRTTAPSASATAGECAFDSTFGQWAVWIVSKVYGGVAVPGLEWAGIFGTVANAVLSQSAAAVASAVAGWIGTALTVLTTVIAAMTFSALVRLDGGEPLVRTHSDVNRGAVDTILVTVLYDFGALGADTLDALNCILFALIAVGSNAALPVPGAVGAGVPVTIHGERPGFGEGLDEQGAFVELDTPLTSETDDTGTARFTVAGRRQKKLMPDSAESYERIFTVALSAKPDPTDISSIMKTFLDSVLCVPGTTINPGACADPITDILRQFNWDLGRWAFSLTDWRSGWAIHDSLHPEQSAAGVTHYDGVSCDSRNGPWHIVVSFAEPSNILQDVSFDVTLNADGIGSVVGTEYSTWDDGLTVNGSSAGTAQLTKVGVAEGSYELLLDYLENVTYTYAGRSWLDSQVEIHHVKTIKVIPASEAECAPPS